MIKTLIKKKFLLSLLLIIFVLIFLLINQSINDNRFAFIKKLIPNEIKHTIKYYLFSHKIIEEKEKKLSIQGDQYDNVIEYLKFKGHPLKDEIKVKERLEELNFNRRSEKIIKIFNKTSTLETYKNEFQINSGIWNYFPGSAYLEYFENNLFIISSTGILAFTKKTEGKKIIFKQIKNNIDEFINEKQFIKGPFSIKDLKIYNGKIYVSFTNELKENCWSTSIIYAELNYEEVIFENLFEPNQCAHSYDDEDFNRHSSAGRIAILDENHIIFSHGDYGRRKSAQNEKTIFGKILKININNGNYSILSMGHRNPQGLYYNQSKNFVLSTEHGPQGGDEINLITLEEKKIFNYGWPISSYGEHYGGREGRNKHKYKNFPLHKSHKDYGFEEPLKYFVPSIAPSEIVGVGNEKYIFASMKDKSIYTFELDKNNIIQNLKRIQIDERIRDLIYSGNKIFLFLENSASIAILNYN